MKPRLIAAALLLLTTISYADIKDLTPSDWSSALDEIGAKSDPSLLEKLTKSGETLDKVNMQTRGALGTGEWISIFNKLGLAPKQDMRPEEWETFFKRIGIKAKFANLETLPTPPPASALPETGTPTSFTPMPVVPAQAAVPASPAAAPSPVPTSPAPSAPVAPRSSKISLDLRGMDILSVLKLISQKSDLNIVAGSNVKGNVTIYLKDVDAIDALKMILEMNDLAYVYEDTVIKVMTAQDYEKIYGKRFYDRTTVEIIALRFGKADNITRTLTPVKSKIGQIIPDSASNSLIVIDTPANIAELRKIIDTLDVKVETKVFPLNYTKAKDISDKMKNSLSPGIGDVQVDERSNQLIITDASSKMNDIAQLITSLDKRHREVLIEAKIIQLMHDNETKTGISWESVINNINNQAVSGRVVANMSNISRPQTISLGGETGLQLSVGTLALNNFTAVLDMLQTVGKTDLVASPRIAAVENKEAKILVGTKEAYVTTQVTNPGSTTTSPIIAESVNFVDVGMKLYVTPTVGDDGFITMKIRPEVSSVERILRTSQNNPIPIVRTSESETTVMVKDGITIVIAGLMEEKEIKKTEGIPLLSRIPLLGLPFRRDTTQKVKTELIVFLTPRVMTGDVSSDETRRLK